MQIQSKNQTSPLRRFAAASTNHGPKLDSFVRQQPEPEGPTPPPRGPGLWAKGLLAGVSLLGVAGSLGVAAPQAQVQVQKFSARAIGHPLEALRADELESAAKILKDYQAFPEGAIFPLLTLQEPTKEELAEFKPGEALPRRATAVILDHPNNKTFEATVDLAARQVTSWKEVEGVKSQLGDLDYETAETLIAADPRWQEALAKRGVTDPSKVYIDTWAMGPSVNSHENDDRLVRALAFYKGDAYPYARPIEGLTSTVNVTKKEVLDVVDTGVVPIATASGAFDQNSVGPLREAPKPLRILQPEGVSFKVEGNEITWQNWKFRHTMHPREGPVLHQIRYDDQGKERSIIHRASLNEMSVPYGDPAPNWNWRSAFDVGEYGFGRRTAPLVPGVDVPENAVLFPATFADNQGRAYTIPRAVAIYERDGGIAWKHYDSGKGSTETRRARELVMTFHTAIGNYDYGVNYIFKQDGSMEVKVDLTGLMLAKGIPASDHHGHDEHEKHGHKVEEGVTAPHHQHFFSFRLDFDVDGTGNTVMEHNTSSLPNGPQNPAGNAFEMTRTPITSEAEGMRNLSLANGRKWSVVNPNVHNRLGGETGFALLPSENTVPYAQPDNMSRKRAGFIDHHVWVTAYKPEEMYAAGDYPNQSTGGAGLPEFIKDNQALENKDVVMWYTLGCTHIPRPEEWPIMPASQIGFKLIPVGFFSRNPALDLPNSPTTAPVAATPGLVKGK